MQAHTRSAVVLAAGLYLVAVPLLLVLTVLIEPNDIYLKIIGPGIYLLSAYIFWKWLAVDAPLNAVPKGAVLLTLVVYLLVFVFAPVGYLFYSRGFVKGFRSVSWFVLFVASLILGLVLTVRFLNFLSTSVLHGP